jgi:hypothetical protein
MSWNVEASSLPWPSGPYQMWACWSTRIETDPPTVSQDFDGDMTVGLVIDPRCVDGFDLAAFNVPDQAGG